MRLEQSFDVAAPPDVVWSALIDVQRVAPCLPGAEITEARPDNTYEGSFSVKLGPTTAAYRGTLALESLDEAGRVAVMRASGTDKRGQGGAKATITSRVSAAPDGGTRVEVATDYSITGRLARFGRSGMIQDISNRLLREFASCLQAELAAGGGTGAGAPAPTEAAGAPATQAAAAGAAAGPAPAAEAPGAGPGAGAPPAPAAPEEAPGAQAGAVSAAPPAAEAQPPGAQPPLAPPAAAAGPRPPAQPLDAGSLVLSVLRDRLGRALRGLGPALRRLALALRRLAARWRARRSR